jgi:hypothetical protein
MCAANGAGGVNVTDVVPVGGSLNRRRARGGWEMEERRRWGFMRATGSEISSSQRGGNVGVSAAGLFRELGGRGRNVGTVSLCRYAARTIAVVFPTYMCAGVGGVRTRGCTGCGVRLTGAVCAV